MVLGFFFVLCFGIFLSCSDAPIDKSCLMIMLTEVHLKIKGVIFGQLIMDTIVISWKKHPNTQHSRNASLHCYLWPCLPATHSTSLCHALCSRQTRLPHDTAHFGSYLSKLFVGSSGIFFLHLLPFSANMSTCFSVSFCFLLFFPISLSRSAQCTQHFPNRHCTSRTSFRRPPAAASLA